MAQAKPRGQNTGQDEEPPIAKVLPVIAGKWTSRALYAVCELGVPDALADVPRSVDALAEATGTHAGKLERIMRALASLGIFREDAEGRYRLTPAGNLLRSDVPESVRGFVLIEGRAWHDQAWQGLLEGLRTDTTPIEAVHGAPSMDRFMEDRPEDQQAFQDGLTGLTTGVAPLIADVVDPDDGEHIVDVGGGHGALLAALLEAAPGAQGTLFDLASVIGSAGEPLERAGVADRCELVGGDFFEGVPEDGSVYVLSQILHNWEDEQALGILANVRDAISPEGRVVIVDSLLAARNEPDFGKLLDLELLVMESGGQRTQAEILGLVEKAGFEVEQVVETPTPFAVVEAQPA